MEKRNKKIIVIGGGLAGLAATMKLCEFKAEVVLVSYQAVKRSHSVCAQGGINVAIDTKGEGDSPEIHFYDTIKGGDFLAHQPLVRDMCHQAPAIIHLMDRLGVAFNRTPEGHLEFRRFGGTLYSRTAFAGATTGQQLVYSMDEQVRKYEHDGLVTKMEWHEYLGAILDEQGICRGAILHDLRTGEIFSLSGDAVVLATGGPGQVYGRSTNSTVCTGAAATSAFLQGAKYANGEFIQIHPTAIPGQDKLRLMSESARGEGGRIWVPRKPQDTRDPMTIPEKERDKYLQEKLKAEWPGILRWAIEGCLAWQKYGLAPPEAVRKATEAYFEAEDALSIWIDECCTTDPNDFAAISDLYAKWREWAERAGELTDTMKSFSQKLDDRGFTRDRKSNERGFRGICLIHEDLSDTPWNT